MQTYKCLYTLARYQPSAPSPLYCFLYLPHSNQEKVEVVPEEMVVAPMQKSKSRTGVHTVQ